MATTGTSTSGQIRILEHIQAVQERPQMFIGETDTPTHLWIEAIDNARDECLSGHSNRIDVFSEDTPIGKSYVVRDYGRGIPITSTEVEGDVPIAICTKLYSGGKFGSGLYDFSSGLHGVGLTVINALSVVMKITTRASDNIHHYVYTFNNGAFTTKDTIILSGDPNERFSTEIRFTPDNKYFNTTECDTNIIANLLKIARYGLNDNIQIYYQKEAVINDLLETFKGGNTCADMITGEYIDKHTKQSCRIDIALYNDFDSGKVFNGIVNLLQTNEGTHMNLCFNHLKNRLYEISQKGKNKSHLQINDLLVPIRVLCTLKIKNPRFPAQTKGKLVTDKSELEPLIVPVIDNLIKKNPKFFDTVIDIAEAYRVHLQTSKQSKKATFGRIVKVEGLKDCSCKDPSKCTLYIVEGQSAGTTLTKCRNPKYDAYLALRGKVLNVISSKATTSKILSNQVIAYIAMAMGYKLFQPMDPKKCRYSKVMFLADSDVDGAHIATLLITMFYTLFPELIKAGMVYVIEPPLYGTWIKKQFVPIFTDTDRDKYREMGMLVHRYKGNGEMDPDELYYSAINESTRKCLQLKWEDFSMEELWQKKLGILEMQSYKV